MRAEERVLLALADGVEFVALWYGAQKIGAVTAEAYTFLQPKDYAYYLDYTRASVVVADATTLERVRQAAASSPLAAPGARRRRAPTSSGPARPPSTRSPPRRRTSSSRRPTTRDDIAIWKFTTGSTGLPKAAVHPQHSPLLSFDWYARGVLGIREDDVVLPVPKLFFGYARDLAALYPFGVGGRRDRVPRAHDAGADLRAGRAPPADDPRPRADDDGRDDRPPRGRAQDLSCLRLCTSAGEALPAELHERWRATFGVEVLDGIGSSEAYHIYISNRPGRVRPGSARRGRAGLSGARRRRGRAASCPTARSGRSGSRATRPRSCTGTSTRSRSGRSPATS